MNPVRDGWIIEHEAAPSRNRHFLPTGQGHELHWNCWCKPSLEGQVDRHLIGTLLTHKDRFTL